MANGVTARKEMPGDDMLAKLLGWFLEAEDSGRDAREYAERDRDYYDGKQWTSAEKTKLEARGQAAIVINRVKRKVDFLTGSEIQARTDPKAFPRTPNHEQAAEAATDALRYVCQNNDFDIVRSDAWENMVVEGTGACAVLVKPVHGEPEISLAWVPWDRLFWDPHSRKRDFSDARYKGVVIWMDQDEAVARWPGHEAAFEEMIQTSTTAETYDDRPKFNVWADKKRKRVRVVEIHYKDGRGAWHWAFFTKAAMLQEPALSPFVDENGEPESWLIMSSLHVDRDNNRYGAVREMIGPQQEVNHRRSKALHLLSVRQVRTESGAVEDVGHAKRELAKPDGWIETNPNLQFEILPTNDMAQAQFSLLQESKAEIDGMGPNASLQGKQDRELSGRALLAQQQGGFVELGRAFDTRRQWDLAVYRQVWNRIRQFWTAERWVRVTDDDDNLKFVGLNQPVTAGEQVIAQLRDGGADQATLQAAVAQLSARPEAQQVVAVENEVAEMDVDIILEEAPDTVNIQQEQFDGIVKMATAGVPFPPEVIIEASSLRNKKALLEKLQGGDEEARAEAAEKAVIAEELQVRGAIAQIEKTEAEAEDKQASAEERRAKALATLEPQGQA